jgi:hypothetical protein
MRRLDGRATDAAPDRDESNQRQRESRNGAVFLRLEPRVGDAEAARSPPRQANEAMMHRRRRVFVRHRALPPEFQDSIPKPIGRDVGGHRLADRDANAIRNPARPFPEELALLEAENAPPDAVEVDRDHRRGRARQDVLKTALEGEHHAGARDMPLGEDADELAALERLGGFIERSQERARALIGRDRDRAHDLQEKAEERSIEEPLPDDEADRTRRDRQDEQGIDERDVIANQKRRAVGRDAPRADDADAIDEPRQHDRDQAEEGFGEERQEVGGRAERDDRDDRENLRRREAERVDQRPINAACDEHAGEVDEVHRGDDAAALLGRGALLQERVERDREESRRRAQEHQEAEHHDRHRSDQQRGLAAQVQAPLSPRHEFGRCERQRQREERDADAAERNEAQLDASTRQRADQKAADGDADGRDRRDRHGQFFSLESQPVNGPHRGVGQDDDPQEPEVTDAEDA